MDTLRFLVDQRGLPEGFTPALQDKFVKDTTDLLRRSFGIEPNSETNKHVIAVAIGAVLNRGFTETTGPDFRAALESAWRDSLGETTHNNGTKVSNRTIYDEIVKVIPKFPGREAPAPDKPAIVFFQELAFVAEAVIENAPSIPLGHPNFPTQVRLSLDRYVQGLPPTQSLSISLALGDSGEDLSIEPENIRTVGTVAFGYQCERMRLFHVVDRVTELFMNGLLPIGFDAGGKLLDTYYWDSEDRLNEATRNMTYSRVLGVPGGDVSRDVQPNKNFENLFLRFIASLAEFDRQQRVTDLFESARGGTLRLTAEQVRKTGRDLAANVSLYGWGGTQFVARRIKDHILRAFDILKNPQVQRAYGVTNPYQVIERVSINEFGAAPNIVKHKTIADAMKEILDVVARRTNAWSTSSRKPLFPDFRLNGDGEESDIPASDMQILMLQAQNYLSVNGVPNDQVSKLLEPSDTVFAPSMPAFGAVSPKGASATGGGPDVMDRLKQMVSAGQTPTLDQLKQLVSF